MPTSPVTESSSIINDSTGRVSSLSLLLKNSLFNPFAMFTQLAIAVFGIQLWIILLRQDSIFNLFSMHPMFNSIAVIGFAQGIILLQPTKTAAEKKKGLALHQIFQLAASMLIIVGTLAIIYNKMIHGASHFLSFHGKVGITTFGLIFVQIAAGAIFVWSPLTGLVGGDLKAKSYWKYHRAGGYLTLTGLIAAPLLAVDSDWVVGKTSQNERYILGGALLAAAIGLVYRINFSKLGLPSRVRSGPVSL